MDEKIAQALMQSLLARLDADARREIPQLEGVVSSLERQALRTLLEPPGHEPQHVQSPLIPPPPPQDLVEEIEEPHAHLETVEEPPPVEEPQPEVLMPGPRGGQFT